MGEIQDIYCRNMSGNTCEVDDYLVSPSRIYFGILEGDGKFVIYRGGSPEDRHDALWSTSVSDSKLAKSAQQIFVSFSHDAYVDNPVYIRTVARRDESPVGPRYYSLWTSGKVNLKKPKTDTIKAGVEDDGNFCLYVLGQGEPSSEARVGWKSNKTDPVVEYIVDRIEYDTPRAKIGVRKDTQILEQTLTNNSSRDQSMQMSKSTSTTVLSSWSNTTGFKATVGGKVTVGVPGVSSGEANWSFEVSNTFTLGGSTSTTSQIGFNFNLLVPANATYRGWAQIQEVEFELPYTVFGELHFKSGRKMWHKLSGTYQGKNGYVGVYVVDDITPGKEKAELFRAESPAALMAQIQERT